MNKEDIEELKREIKALKQANIEYKDRIDKAITHIQYGIDNEDYNCPQESSWIKGPYNETLGYHESYYIDEYFSKSIEILRGESNE